MKKKLISLIFFILLCTFSLNVFAKEKVDLNIDKNSVDLGDEITVSINFSKEEQVAYAYTAKLSYDEDVFETIDTENFEEQENWSDINYNMNNKKFALINKSGESGKNLVKIKLKVRDEAKQGKTTISVGNVTSTNGNDDISIDGSSVEVQVGKGTQNTTPDEIKNTSNDKISVKTEKNTYKNLAIIPIILIILIIAFLIYINIKKDTTNKNKKTVISIICGIILLLLLIITINILRTEKTDVNNDDIIDYEDSEKIVNYLLEIENPDMNETQLDANLDGEISTADIGKVLQSAKDKTEYTTEITATGTSHNSGNNSSSSANNSNNEGSSGSQGGQEENPGGSLGSQGGQEENPGGGSESQGGQEENPDETVEKVENKNDTNQGIFQFKKGEKIELVFDIKVTPKTGVKEVVIGGKTYQAIYNEEEGLYYVAIPATDLLGENKTYGKNRVELTEVVLDNSKHLKLGKDKLSLDIEILKKEPTIVGEIEYSEAGPSVTVTFDDPDNALKDGGYVYLYKKDSEDNAKIVMAKIDSSKFVIDGTRKTITININEFKYQDGSDANIQNGDYNIFVQVPYQLDEEGVAKSNPLTAKLDSVHIVTDYNFDFYNLQIAREQNGLEKITPTTVKLQFTSTNEAVNSQGVKVTVSKVKVKIGEDEQEIPASSTIEDLYEVEVNHKGETKQTIIIESVELSNGRVENIENQNVTIFLNKPVAENFDLKLGDKNTNITAEYNLQDIDNTISKEGTARVDLIYKLAEGENETVLDSKDIPIELTQKTVVDFGKKIEDYKEKITNYEYNEGNGIYTVKLYIDYAKIDGKRHSKLDESGFITETSTTRNVERKKEKPIIVPSIDRESIPNKLTIEVSDPDKAFRSGTISIKKSDGTLVKNQTFTTDGQTNPYEYILDLDKEYLENGNYSIEISYTYVEKEGEQELTETLEKIDLTNFVSDYGIEFVRIENIEVQEYKKDIQDGFIKLKFNATTKTENAIKAMKLDENILVNNITREGDIYTAKIPYNSNETKRFQITKLILDNGYAENLDTERTDTIFEIYLNKPEIENLELAIDGTNKQITAKAKIKNDQNGNNYKARLTYPNNSDTVEINITKGESGEYTGTFGKPANVAGEYKLEILADYDLKNGQGLLKNQLLKETSKTEELVAKIIEGSIERNQPTKGEIVTITYKVYDNTGKEVKYIEVNGNQYEAKVSNGLATDNETTYTVDVPVPLNNSRIDDETGAPMVKFTATKLIYEGEEEELDPPYTFEQKVQNAKPTFENTLENKDEDNNKPQMKFHFTDPNENTKAFKKATVKLKDESGKVVKTREFTEINKDYYFLLFEEIEDANINGSHPEGAEPDTFTGIVEGETYSIEIVIEYDVQGKETETGTITEVIEGLQIKAGYNLIINTKQEETKIDANTRRTTITFTSSNDLNAEIASVTMDKTVNGKTETMENIPISTFAGDKYTVEIATGGEEEEQYKHEYNIKSVKLKTGVIIDNFKEGSTTQISTHYVAPTATLETPNISEEGTITTKLKVIDPEKILTEPKVSIYKKQGEQEEWQEDAEMVESNTTVLEEGENKKDYQINFKSNYNSVGEYIIKVIGSYERLDGKSHENEELANTNVKVEPKVTNFTLTANPYVEKNTETTLNISAPNNTGSTITKIVLKDNKNEIHELDVTSNQAVLTSHEKAGEVTYTATKLIFADGTEISLENESKNEIKIYVLKTEPKVEYSYNDDDVHNPKIKVKVTDDDGALEGKKVTLKVIPLPEGKEIVNQEIYLGEEKDIKLPELQNKQQYKVEIRGTYDLDDEMGNANYNENHNFLSEEEKIVGFKIEDFQLTDVNVTSVSRTENFAEITFKSTNNTYTDNEIGEYYVTHIMLEGMEGLIEVTRTSQNTEGFDTYTAKIPYTELDKYQMYKITGAQVIGGKLFTLDDVTATFEIFKQMPTAEITKARIIPEEEENAGNIEVTYKITSGLNSINTLTIKVFDKDGVPMFTTSDKQVQTPDAENTEKTVVLNHAPKYAGPHTVRLLLTGVNLNDGKTHGEQVLAENKEINVPYTAEIINTKMEVVETKKTSTNSQITAGQGQEVQIDYTIKTNRPINENLNGITLKATGNEGKEYPIGDNNKIVLDAPIITDSTQETATYRIKVTVPNEAEPFEEIKYEVESVQFDSDILNTAILPENVATIKVQKQKPELLSITYEPSTRTVSVKVKDEDLAITKGNIVIKKGETEITTRTFGTNADESTKIQSEDGVYNIVLDNTDDIETANYTVDVTGTYDIGDGEENLKALNSTITIYNGEYGFTLDDVKVTKVQNDADNKFVYISFKSTNNHNLPIKAVLVQEEELQKPNQEQAIPTASTITEHRCDEIQLLGQNEYQIKVPFTQETPKQYTITEAILDNTVGFKANVEPVKVFKEEPVASDLELNIKENSAKFTISDPDETIKSAKAVVINNKTQEEVMFANISDFRSKEIKFTQELMQGEYILAIQATFDKFDGKGDVTKNIGITEKPEIQEIKTEVTAIQTENNKRLYAKTEQVNATVHVTDNTKNKIVKFYVHCTPEEGQEIVFEDIPNEDEKTGTYTITTPLTPTTGETAVIPGKRTCRVQKVAYENPDNPTEPIIVEVPQNDQNMANIEILKDEPKLSYEKQEKDGKALLTVKLSNPDKADVVHVSTDKENPYESGAIITLLKKGSDGQYQEVKLDENNKLIGTADENKSGNEATREIPIEENGTYYLKVEGTAFIANRLENPTELASIAKNLSLEQPEIKIVKNYDFQIQNEKVIKVDRDAKTATIEFESTNLANEIIKSIEIGENRYEDIQFEVVQQEEPSEVTKYKYTVILKNIEPDKRQEISFRRATLNDGKEFNEISNSIVIYKTTPNATITGNIEIQEGQDETEVDANRIIKGSFQLQDPDKCVTNTYINVIKPNGEPLFETPRSMEQGEFNLDDIPVNQKGDYKVQVLADYDRNCGEPLKSQELANTKVTINVDANIISNTAESYYVEKGEEIKINYTIEDNAEGTDRFKPNGFKVVTTIDGTPGQEEFKPVTQTGAGEGPDHKNEEYYELTFNAPTKPTTVEVEVKSIEYFDTVSQTSTSAIMKAEDQTKTKIDVLKSEMSISDYAFDGKQDLRFKLVDEDDAFTTKGKVTIKREGESEPIQGGELTFDKTNYQKDEENIIKVPGEIPTLEEGQKYDITIEAGYDRTILTEEDLSKENKNQEYKGTLKKEEKYHFVVDYKFQYDGTLKLENVDETTGKLKVSFACGFAEDENLELTQAYFLGKFYDVEKLKDGRYQATIDFANNETKLELKLIAVKFSNGRILKQPNYEGPEIKESEGKNEPQLENAESIYVFLTRPALEEAKAEFTEENKIKVNFKLKDPDKTVSKIKAQVIKGGSDSTNVDTTVEIPMPDLTSGEADVNYEIDRKYTDAGTYTVKLQFTYDRHGSQTHIDEVLDNGTLSLKLDNWVNIETDDRKINKFIERGVEGGDTQIPITFTISDNEEKEIKALKLEDDDNKEYHLEKVEGVENQYKTTFTLPTQSGKHTFKVKKVVYDQLTVTLPNTYDTTVEILKQRPTVDIVECNHNDRTIKFTVVDPEDTISEGKAEITSEDGQTVYKTIEINSNNVDEKEILLDFKQDKDGNPIPTDKKLKLKVTAKYSLDEDGEKQEEKELATQEIATLDIKYNFELQGVKVTSVDRENTTAKLELTVKDNSTQMGGDSSEYKFQNFSIEGLEGTVKVEQLQKDNQTGIATYTADFPYSNELEGQRQEYTINKVLIGTNEKQIEGKNFILFKTKPVTKELEIDPQHISTESATATFKINDPDKALINAKVGLYEYKYYQDYNEYMDVYIDDKEITENADNNYEITLDGQKFNTNSKYTVKIEGQYDLADGNNIAQMEEESTQLIGDEKSATTQFSIPIQAKVEEIKSTGGEVQEDGSIVVDKNKTISMYYRISDNTDLQIKKIVLIDKNTDNKTTWTATKITTGDYKPNPEKGEVGDVYRISYGGKSLAANAGVQDLEIKEIQYDRSRVAESIEQKDLKFKVRKLMPTVTYAGKGTLEEPEADFRIDDPDNAIIGGTVSVEIYGTDDDINNETAVTRGKQYLKDANIKLEVNQDEKINFSEYSETLPDGTYDIKLKGEYNLYGNDNDTDTVDYEVVRNFTVLKGAYFTFENLNIYPEYIQEMGLLSGMVNIHTENNLTVKGINVRFYQNQQDTSDTEGTYIDYMIDETSLFCYDEENDLYMIMDYRFLASPAREYIKVGQNPLKVLDVVATDSSGKEVVFKVNELSYVNITRRQGQLAYFDIKEKTNIDKVAKTVSTDLEGYITVNDLEDYYVPGSLSACVYDENGELIAEQPIDKATDEDKAKLQARFDEIDKMPVSDKQKSDLKEDSGYHKDIIFKNIPIAKSYRVEIHGKWYNVYDDPNLGRMEEIQEGIVKMKHRRFIGAEASPSVDAKLNVSATVRVGIEDSKTYVKNEEGEWAEGTYVAKGEEVKIEYLIRGNMDAGTHITSATINGQDVELSVVDGKVDVYETTVKVPDEAGKFKINLTRVGLNTKDYKFTVDGEEYILNSTPVDVLTEAPKVDSFKLDYESYTTPKLTFNITEEKQEDEEQQLTSKTIKNAAVKVYNYIDNNNETYKDQDSVQTYNLKTTGEAINLAQEIELNSLNLSTRYWLTIETTYSLVENEESEVEGITKFSNIILYSSPLIIQADDNIKVIDLSAPESVEKNQEIELNFKFSAGEEFIKPVKLKVKGNDTSFNVTESEEGFKANITGYSVSGIQEIELDEIVLNIGKVIELEDNIAHKVKVEICKDIIGVKDFSFKESGKEITLDVSLKDRENSLVGENIEFEVYEDGNEQKIEGLQVEGNPKTLTYTAKFQSRDARKYKCVIKATYSKLKNGKNPTTDEIYTREFSLDDRTIEIKDITNIELMKFENGVTRKVEGLTLEELEAGAQYFVRVSMSNASAFYSDISYYEKQGDKLVLTLNYVGAKQYTNGEEGSITVELLDSNTKVDEHEYYVTTSSFTGLMYYLRNNPTAEVTLNHDLEAYDYSGPTDDNVYVNVTFKGKIHGNGHKIKNIERPIFKSIEGAEIENLTFTNAVAKAKTGVTGLLAGTAKRSTIKRVNFSGVNFTITNYCATMVASATEGTTIEECEITGMTLTYSVTNNSYVGGLVDLADNAIIRNCRVEGVIGGWPGWYQLGGIIGRAQNVTIENCVSNVDVNSAYGNTYTGGAVIGASKNLIMRNCASVSDGGNISPIIKSGQPLNNSSTNNFACSTLPDRHESKSITYQEQKAFTKEFYENTLKLDPKLWDFEGCGGEVLPKLKSANASKEPTTPNIEIPEYERVSKEDGYDPTKEILYHNLSKLAPYYDSKYIIEDAKNVSNNDDLNKKIIQGILPISNDGKIVNSLTNENYKDIAKIKLVFKDRTIKEYEVKFETYFGNVVCYNIPNLYNFKYNFKNYVINKDAAIVKELTDYVKNMNYVISIDPLTKTKDSRLYAETFDDSTARDDKKYSNIFNEKTVKQEAEQVVLDLLANNNYNITNDDVKTSSVIKNELLSNKRLERYLFTYTYIKRWYNINVEDFNLKDILLYHTDIFEGGLTFDIITNRLLLNDSNMATSATHTFYANNIGNMIGLSQIGDFIDFFIQNTERYHDRVNDWLSENFNGFILESRLDNQDDRLRYRAWDYLKCWPHTLLPVLRLPKNAAYIYSCPTQIHIGATRVYYADPEKNAEAMRKKMQNFANSVKKNYETIYGMIGGGSSNPEEVQKAIDLFNRKNDIQTDTNIAYDGEYVENKYLAKKAWQYVNQTQEDYHKWFAEATGIWTARIGAAAYAYGTRILWENNALLDNFKIWSHETMHDQDGALILKNHNRRPAVGGESYSDGFLTQSYEKPGYCKFNFPVSYDSNTSHTVNWTGDRISSPEKVEDYYNKAFQVNYFLDYMIAQALFTLDASEQESVLSKMPDTSTTPSRAGKDFTKVSTIDDLINGQYAIDYGAEGYRTIRWYNPLSDVNYTSLDNLWVMAYEMLGYAGYDDGWLLWTTDILKTAEDPLVSDQNALKEITKRKNNGVSLDIKQYKKARFDEAAANADKLSYMDTEDIKNQFIKTLKEDAASVKSSVGTLQMTKTSELKIQIFNKLKKYTDDLRSTPFGKQADNKEVEVTTGEQFIEEITKNSSAKIKLANDIDLSKYKEGTSMVRSTFVGEINGDGNVISGVQIPIFESTLNAKFNNFTIENPQISLNRTIVGALSNNTGNTTITSVKVHNGSISSNGKETVGGLVGQAQETTFDSCSVDGTTVSGAKNVGGLVGNVSNTNEEENNSNTSTIKNSYTYEVTVNGTTKVGGLVGNLEKFAKIETSSTLDTTVHGTQDSVGGLVGEINKGTIENSYSTGTVTGMRKYTGGLVGFATDPVITNCYTTCIVKGESYIGGFIGTVRNTGTIKNCISLAIMDEGAAKFDTGSDSKLVEEGFINNYEIKELSGRPSSYKKVKVGNVAEISYNGSKDTLQNTTAPDGWLNGLNNENFWNHTGDANNRDYGVNFNNGIWKIPTREELAQGELPILTGAGNPDNTKVVMPQIIQPQSEPIKQEPVKNTPVVTKNNKNVESKQQTTTNSSNVEIKDSQNTNITIEENSTETSNSVENVETKSENNITTENTLKEEKQEEE